MLLAYYSNRTREADDKRLWAALRSGRQEALEELFRCYHKQLYNYGLKMSGDRELVQEAIQQLFLNLWKRRFFLSEAESVRAYLISSLRRLILEQIKRNKARAARNRVYIENDDALDFNIEEILIRRETDREKEDILQKVLNELTPRQKEAVFLRFYHGLTNREIEEVMNLNDQCVRNLLYDALRRLRKSVEGKKTFEY